MGWTMSTWLNRGASGGLAGALKIERSNPQPIHLSQVKACSDERSRLSYHCVQRLWYERSAFRRQAARPGFSGVLELPPQGRLY
jgi:hypothetical protein